jgi:hypothetical protein
MRKFVFVAFFAALLSLGANAHDDSSKQECEKTKQKIKKLESRMRHGYSRAQGEKWRTQLRALRAARWKQCR